MSEIKTVGVIGAGQMGSGIAHVVALAAMTSCCTTFRGAHRRGPGPDREEPGPPGRPRHHRRRGHGRGPGAHQGRPRAWKTSGQTDLAIEAATENEERSRRRSSAACSRTWPDTLLASNTSSISITRLASATDRPERFIGLHFMNPVPLMKLVEIIRGIATDVPTYEPPCLRPVAGQDHQQRRGLPRLHRQPRAGADDQRGDLHPVRGRGHGRRHRHRHEAGRQPSDGPAGAGRLHRPGHRAEHHERAARGPGRQQVPPLPAAGEICRGRLAGQEGRSRLLRLSRRVPRGYHTV
jgi:hypothetical protein